LNYTRQIHIFWRTST